MGHKNGNAPALWSQCSYTNELCDEVVSPRTAIDAIYWLATQLLRGKPFQVQLLLCWIGGENAGVEWNMLYTGLYIYIYI